MSYDYNALVEEISQHRQQLAAAAEATAASEEDEHLTHLQGAMDGFARLSSHCPMTPRLWMQYAHDAAQFVLETATDVASNEAAAAATSTRLDILELGLNEFPGCAMLHVHYLELLAAAAATATAASPTAAAAAAAGTTSTLQQQQQQQEYHEKFVLAFRRAVTMVGSGSHRNEDMGWIANLFRLGVYYSAQRQQSQSHNPNHTTTTTTITWADVFLQRSQTPMQHGNEALISEFLEFAKSHSSQQQQQPNVATLQTTMEEHRRSIRFLDSFLARYEDEVDVALQAEGVLARPDHFTITSCPTQQRGSENELFWKDLLQPTSASASTLHAKPYANGWMGLGGNLTAKVFIKYAQALTNYHWTKEKLAVASESMNHSKIHQLILSVYERGIAECPTVESLWLAYLGYLTRSKRKDSNSPQKKNKKDESAMITEDEDDDAELIIDWDKCQSVAHRAVRNCPYSIPLLQQRMKMALLMSNANVTVLDPDTLMTMVQEALATGFITTTSPENARLELYLTAVRMVQRRILFLLTNTTANGTVKSYDEAAFPAKTTGSQQLPPLDSKLQQEIEDLCDDLRDMYETADESLRSSKEPPKQQQPPQHTTLLSSQMARFILWKDRCRCERDLLSPYRQSLQLESDTTTEATTKQSSFEAILACHDQWIRLQQPAHPDSYAAYIDAVRSCSPVTHPSDIITKFQWIRALYQKGLSSAASASASTSAALSPSSSPLWSLLGRDYEAALREFCQSYLEFEHLFGSEESHEMARQAIDKKRGAVWSAAAAAAVAVTSSNQGAQPMEDTHTKGRKSKPSSGKSTVASGSTVTNTKKPSPEKEVNVTKRSRPAEEQLNEDSQVPPLKKLRAQEDHTDNHKEEAEPLTVAMVSKPDGGPLESAMVGMQLETPTAENDEESKAKKKHDQQHKVRIGNLEYPAHPFTIRVSNLTSDTQDMDLVDVFRPKCGPIVHAKIVRDRHPPHASKGWGLVQFEDREAVDKALALHDVIGIHERLAQVERSHMPAATLVPPGKHRVNPQGQGKVSKRNQKRREGKDPKQAKDDNDDDVSMGEEQKQQPSKSSQSQKRAAKDSSNSSESKTVTAATPAAAATANKGSATSVFSFRPRNVVVGHKNDHRKVKLALDKNAEK